MSVDTFRNGEYFSSWSAFELKARMNQLAIPWANGTACPSGPPPKVWASLCVAVRWHFHRPHQCHDGLANVLRQVRPASQEESRIKLGLCQWVGQS